MFSYYPAWALFGLVLTHITHEVHMCIYTYLWPISIAKDRRFAEECLLRLYWN